MRADESGQPVLDADGRAEMKYRETDTKSYRPSPGNLMPDEGGARGERPRPAARPSPSGAREGASGARRRGRASARGLAIEICGPTAPAPGIPGPMGIGVVVIDGGKRREKGEYLGVGTNNIAELTAIDRARIERAADAARAGCASTPTRATRSACSSRAGRPRPTRS